MKIHVGKIGYGIGVFFLIFAFPLIPALSSAKLILLVVVLIFLVRKNFKQRLYVATESFGKPFLYSYLFVFIYTLSMPIVWMSFDLTLFSKVLSAPILYYVAYFYIDEVKKHMDIDKTIYMCFIVQSVVILLAIVSQSFYDITAPLRDVSEHHQEAYGRLRGNAICGYQFFGLVVMYSLVITYVILHFKRFKYKLLGIPLILLTSICTGRSIILGIMVALAFYLIKEYSMRNIKKILYIIAMSAALFTGGAVVLINNYNKISDPLMRIVVERYLVQPIESITEDSGFETSSTDRLAEMYEEEDIKQYFIFGSGRYTNEDGSYFGHVDIGYYRLMGYSGIVGLISTFVCLWCLFFKSKSSLDRITKAALFTNILVYNFKGGMMVWDNNIIPILVAYLFFTANDCKINCPKTKLASLSHERN